jgi:hypothetical protein
MNEFGIGLRKCQGGRDIDVSRKYKERGGEGAI